MSDIYKLRLNGNTLCSRQTRQFVHKYKSFKWVLSGRWNQGSGNSGATATYMEWDELGIAFDGDTVRYGPSYWTYDSYTLDGTPWDPATRMPPVLLGGTWGSEASKFDASNFVELTVYFHTADNSAILPTRVGLISANNQNEYQSSTPLDFKLYGLNEDTHEYELLIDVNAANVNKSSTTETLVSTGFTYHYSTVTDTWPLSFMYNDTPASEVWVDLGSTEYYLQGNQTRRLAVSLTGMPSSSDMQYFTMLFDAKIWGSTGGQARIIIENNTATSPEDWGYQNKWGMRDHFSLRTPPQFFTPGDGKTWTTDSSATSLVTDCSTSLWPENTYSKFKIVCDRTTSTCYLYIANTFLGIAAGFSNDLITWNQIYLYSDQGRSYEIAAVKNIKVVGFSTLTAARAYSG